MDDRRKTTRAALISSRFLAALLLAAAVASALPPAEAVPPGMPRKPAHIVRVLLRQNRFGARCLDGSPPGFYIRRGYGTGRKSFIIYLQGGGWCHNVAQCAERTQTVLGSSKFWRHPTDPGFQASLQKYGSTFTGILSRNATENPSYYNWHVVNVFYCDGGGFSGTAGAVRVNNTFSMHLDGAKILQAVLEDLQLRWGMRTAKRVLFTGCSAGGQAVSNTCDIVADQLPWANVKCLMDGGFFLDGSDVTGQMYFRTLAKRMTELHHSIMDPDCKNANPRGPWRCFFPQFNLFYISRPLFIVNSVADYAAIEIANRQNATVEWACRHECGEPVVHPHSPDPSFPPLLPHISPTTPHFPPFSLKFPPLLHISPFSPSHFPPFLLSFPPLLPRYFPHFSSTLPPTTPSQFPPLSISSPPRLLPIGPPSSSHLLYCSISPTAPPHFSLFSLSFTLLLPLISTGSPPLLPPSSAGFSRHQLNASPSARLSLNASHALRTASLARHFAISPLRPITSPGALPRAQGPLLPLVPPSPSPCFPLCSPSFPPLLPLISPSAPPRSPLSFPLFPPLLPLVPPSPSPYFPLCSPSFPPLLPLISPSAPPRSPSLLPLISPPASPRSPFSTLSFPPLLLIVPPSPSPCFPICFHRSELYPSPYFPLCFPLFPPLLPLLSPHASPPFTPCIPSFLHLLPVLSPPASPPIRPCLPSFRPLLPPFSSMASPPFTSCFPPFPPYIPSLDSLACPPLLSCIPSITPLLHLLSAPASLPFPLCFPPFPPRLSFLSPPASPPFPPCSSSLPPLLPLLSPPASPISHPPFAHFPPRLASVPLYPLTTQSAPSSLLSLREISYRCRSVWAILSLLQFQFPFAIP
ncbi:unnamed protein product [Closterium sp. Naga37s-1]|nr:unnamed protein product [Closterium sp. Naga37s-1]